MAAISFPSHPALCDLYCSCWVVEISLEGVDRTPQFFFKNALFEDISLLVFQEGNATDSLLQLET